MRVRVRSAMCSHGVRLMGPVAVSLREFQEVGAGKFCFVHVALAGGMGPRTPALVSAFISPLQSQNFTYMVRNHEKINFQVHVRRQSSSGWFTRILHDTQIRV